jgi:hypothetical protein
MRRILRKIAASDYEGLGDVTTLAEPEVVERLIGSTKPAGVTRVPVLRSRQLAIVERAL